MQHILVLKYVTWRQADAALGAAAHQGQITGNSDLSIPALSPCLLPHTGCTENMSNLYTFSGIGANVLSPFQSLHCYIGGELVASP